MCIRDRAKGAGEQFATLDNAIVATTTSTLATVPAAVGAALPSLAAFRESLANMGLDPFLMELQLQNATLKAKLDAVSYTHLDVYKRQSGPNCCATSSAGCGCRA